MLAACADRCGFVQTNHLCSVVTREESEEKIGAVTGSTTLVNVETASTTV